MKSSEEFGLRRNNANQFATTNWSLVLAAGNRNLEPSNLARDDNQLNVVTVFNPPGDIEFGVPVKGRIRAYDLAPANLLLAVAADIQRRIDSDNADAILHGAAPGVCFSPRTESTFLLRTGEQEPSLQSTVLPASSLIAGQDTLVEPLR